MPDGVTRYLSSFQHDRFNGGGGEGARRRRDDNDDDGRSRRRIEQKNNKNKINTVSHGTRRMAYPIPCAGSVVSIFLPGAKRTRRTRLLDRWFYPKKL